MKIDFRGRNLLESSKRKYNLSRKIKIGVITAALVVGIPGLMFLNKNNNQETDFGNPAPGPEYYHEVVQEDPIETTLDQINSLNIIINDNDCADAFITDIYEKLEEDGIQFKKAVKDKGVQENDAVVITLDQQYMAGPGVLVLAPYYNDNKGDSDALALALDTALYEKGFLTQGIECGIRGFREDENGNVMQRIPTSTEEKIGRNTNSSYATITFGTNNANTELVTSAIENALARYYSYVSTYNLQEDLIYRAQKDETLDDIAKKYNTTSNYIKVNNGIITDEVQTDTAIKNPKVDHMREFDHNVPVDFKNVEKTIWAK